MTECIFDTHSSSRYANQCQNNGKNVYRIPSYKALPQIIPAFLIMLAPGTLLCRWNLVISNNTRSWRSCKKIIPAGHEEIRYVIPWQCKPTHRDMRTPGILFKQFSCSSNDWFSVSFFQVLYLMSFGIELWWIIEAEGKITSYHKRKRFLQ